jgi:hypothetical protein
MLDQVNGVKREADLVVLDAGAPHGPLGSRTVRAQNFLIEWLDAKADAAVLDIVSDDEMMLMTFDSGATISGGPANAEIRRRNLAVLPPGAYRVNFNAGRACILSTSRKDRPPPPLNANSYATPDKRVSPVGPAWTRTGDPNTIQIFDIDSIKAPPDNPRLKMFQSATMSINWVDYDGPRDRAALSPHAHANFEQASLAAAGNFVHHLRVSWGKNANEWRDDVHLQAPSPSVVVIPPELIHTTEGVGAGHHLLIDIFAPPRSDFIARKWVLNSHEYEAPRKPLDPSR